MVDGESIVIIRKPLQGTLLRHHYELNPTFLHPHWHSNNITSLMLMTTTMIMGLFILWVNDVNKEAL